MNNSNIKFLTKEIGKYLRELSVVVVGIAITFTISNWIESRNNKKELEENLETVKLELQENLKIVNDLNRDFYKHVAGFSNYLQNNDWQNLNKDSLKYYSDYALYIPDFIVKTSAFEMLKTSGLMRLIKDKKMIQALWNSYFFLERLKIANDSYRQIEITEMERMKFFSIKTSTFDLSQLYGFYSNRLANDLSYSFEYASKVIEETLSQLK